jgi:DNA-binding NarL/FixJ family response regulator
MGGRRLSMSYLDAFTPREREVLALVTQGKSNNEIAAALSIAASTVEHHIHRVLRKGGFKNRTEAAVAALRNGYSEGKIADFLDAHNGRDGYSR